MDPVKKILTFPEEYDSSIPNITLAEYMLGEIEKFADQEACVDSETKKTLTFTQICDMTRSLAAGFQIKYDLKVREAVAIALPTCMEYPIAVMGVNLCGSAAVLFNPSQTTSELKHSIELSKPRLWIGTESFATEKFKELYPNASNRPPMIILSDKSSNVGTNWLDILNMGRGKPVKIPTINCKEDPALILFSSGTTGVPKGVTLTNFNYTTARRQNVELTKNVPPSPDDVMVVMLPLYHTMGISGMLDCLVRGLRYVVIPRFTFRKMLEAIQEHRITIMSVVPAIAAQMVKHPVEKQYDLSSMRVLFSGAAALGKDLQDRLVEKFDCMVLQGYGMTESTMRTHCNFIGLSKEGSIGVTMPFCESKIVNPTTNEALGPNQEGEICVRGPLIMKGYIGNEEATKNMLDAEGWLRTGDIGYYDEEGFFFITDRVKELIKYKGLQVSPSELELLLLTHPDVMDAAVSSIPDEMAGELPRGYVVRKPGSKVTEDELIKFIAEKVSAHKQLRGGVVFVKSIPKTATGKIIRRDLKTLKSKL